MASFDDLGAVQSSSAPDETRASGGQSSSPGSPGTKESRYRTLLSGDVGRVGCKVSRGAAAHPRVVARNGLLIWRRKSPHFATTVADFQKEVAELKQKFADFKKHSTRNTFFA